MKLLRVYGDNDFSAATFEGDYDISNKRAMESVLRRVENGETISDEYDVEVLNLDISVVALNTVKNTICDYDQLKHDNLYPVV